MNKNVIELKQKLTNFGKAARELADEWEGQFDEVENEGGGGVGINDHYPFALEFHELVGDIELWVSEATEKTGLERAVGWIKRNDQNADVEYLIEDETVTYIEAVKQLTIILTQEISEVSAVGDFETMRVINQLIEEL